MVRMAVAVKKLDVQLGDVVEIDGRRYDVVSDKRGGVALEPAITSSVADIHAEHAGRPVTQAEFDELFGDLPSDDEG
jgi:NMD protein affecting ribosome stability and mRNA decay